MSSLAIAAIVLGASFAAALIGMALRVRLPSQHVSDESKDVVKLVMGLIATIAALVLSLLIASAHTSYDLQSSELKALAAHILLLDRTLELYGPGANEARASLRDVVREEHDRVWSKQGVQPGNFASIETRNSARANVEQLLRLAPMTDTQRMLQSKAIEDSETITQTRLLMFEQSGGSVAWPFLLVLVFWICVLFLGFGLFARFNATVTVALFVGALSVAGAIFLILELSHPYHGLLHISDAPLREAISQIDH